MIFQQPLRDDQKEYLLATVFFKEQTPNISDCADSVILNNKS